ncbi:hypothetical protein B0A50_04479 [Salinomyces thailandicus]|uniref:Acyltransferase 3 domain-containing protein n=1 Tax=Salinomyces thailandicus TaxID=706561 RepID=A0A4U0TYH0_9PEZI|nr:hypothetical protein B0A50_04479 [Salinomyces thailandica]
MDDTSSDDPSSANVAVSQTATATSVGGTFQDLETGHGARPSATQPARKQGLPHLDGLRGVAAFMVYMAHWMSYWYDCDNGFCYGFGYHDSNRLFSTLPFVRVFFTGGNPAVAIFFVLSGYVLSISPLRMMLNDEPFPKIRESLVSASIRRPLRLFIPPICMSLLMALALQLPFGLAPWLSWPEAQSNIMTELGTWLTETFIVLNPFVDSGPFGRWFRYDPPTWTIAVEFKGSIVVFFLIGVFSLARPKLRPYLLFGTGLLFAVIYEWALSMFVAGVLLALNDLASLDTAFLKRLTPTTRTVTFHALFFIGWYFLSQPTGMREIELALATPGWNLLTSLTPSNYLEYWRFYEIPGAALLVYGVLRISWLQQFLASRPLRYLGRVSFSFYLVHIPFLWTVGDRICRVLGRYKFAEEPQHWYDGVLAIPDVGPVGLTTGFVISQAIILPMNLALGEVGTKMLDQPSVVAGRWVVAKLRGGKS